MMRGCSLELLRENEGGRRRQKSPIGRARYADDFSDIFQSAEPPFKNVKRDATSGVEPLQSGL